MFLASPGDVTEEREALARLVRDINDVLAFLVPEKRLSLELVRYETHAYPDLGAPQEVINRQIPIDYDVFVGVMWKRCGTPTRKAPSGTIEEFYRAVEKRKTSHLPRIMFYFCEQPMPVPSLEELDQIREVVKFREQVNRQGLTETYPSHASFPEHVRGGLLRAIRDILREESGAVPKGLHEPKETIDPTAQSEVLSLAAEYEKIRREMPSSGARTRRMTAVFSQMKARAAGVFFLLDQFEKSESAGARLAAIAILQMFPRAAHLDWLAHRLDNPEVEKPFVGYQAAVALVEAVRALPEQDQQEIKRALSLAKRLATKLPSDSNRLEVLEIATQEFERRFGKARAVTTPKKRRRSRT